MKVVSKEKVFDNFFIVQKVEVEVSNDGDTATRYYVDKVQGAGILLYNKEENKVILTRQFRVALVGKADPDLVEIPAGIVDPGEDAEKGIIREAMEETGYKIKSARQLFSVYTSPGYNNEEVIIFYGEVSSEDKSGKGGGLEDEHEQIEVIEMDAYECFRLMDKGLVADAKTVIALLWLKNELKNNM